eukprot:114736_1
MKAYSPLSRIQYRTIPHVLSNVSALYPYNRTSRKSYGIIYEQRRFFPKKAKHSSLTKREQNIIPPEYNHIFCVGHGKLMKEKNEFKDFPNKNIKGLVTYNVPGAQSSQGIQWAVLYYAYKNGINHEFNMKKYKHDFVKDLKPKVVCQEKYLTNNDVADNVHLMQSKQEKEYPAFHRNGYIDYLLLSGIESYKNDPHALMVHGIFNQYGVKYFDIPKDKSMHLSDIIRSLEFAGEIKHNTYLHWLACLSPDIQEKEQHGYVPMDDEKHPNSQAHVIHSKKKHKKSKATEGEGYKIEIDEDYATKCRLKLNDIGQFIDKEDKENGDEEDGKIESMVYKRKWKEKDNVSDHDSDEDMFAGLTVSK